MRPVSLPWSAATPAPPGSSADPGCFQGHSDWITSGLLLSDHHTLVTASVDTTVKLWNLRGSASAAAPSSHCVATLTRHTDFVQSLAYSPFNELLVTGGLSFQLYSYRVTPTGPRAVEDLSGGGSDAADASAAAASAGFGLHEFDLLRGSFYSTALSATGDTLVTGSSDEIVRLYDTRSGATACGSASGSKNWLKLLGHRDTIRAVAIDESMGTGLSRVYSADAEGSLKVWDLRTNRCLSSFHPAQGRATRAATEQLHSQPPTPSFSGAARAPQPRASHSRHPIPLDRQVDLRERMRLQQLGLWAVTPASATASPYSAFGRSDGRAAAAAPPPSHSPAIWCMALNAAHTLAFTGGAGPIVHVTDLSTGTSAPLVCFRAHPDPAQSAASAVVCLTLDEARALLWVGTWDGNVSAWDVSHVLRGDGRRNLVPVPVSAPARHGDAAAAAAPLSSASTPVSASTPGVAFGRRRDTHLGATAATSAAAVAVPRHAAPVLDTADDDEDAGALPLLLTAPQLILPLSPLPPMQRCLLLHDKLHVLAQHWSNSVAPALSTTGGAATLTPTAAPAIAATSVTVPPLIVSTWNVLEGVCVDVMRIDGAVAAASPALWNLDKLAEIQNAEFARRFQAHMAVVNPGAAPAAAVPSSKLVPNWCSVDVRLGCICVSMERRSCFAADISKWVQRDLAELPALLSTGAGAGSAASAKVSASATAPLGSVSLLSSRLTASARANLGEQMLFTLFAEWILLEDRILLQAAAAQRRQSGSVEAGGAVGVFVRKAALLLRPVPPSSRVLARFLFPNTVPHAFAGSDVLLRDLHALGVGIGTVGEARSASRHSQPVSPAAASPATPASGIETSLTLLIVPPASSPFAAEACALPLGASPAATPPEHTAAPIAALTPASRSDPLAQSHALHRARNAYLRVVPSWIEGVLFAPGTTGAAAAADAVTVLPPECERLRKTVLEQESAADGQHFVLKSRSHVQTEQAQAQAQAQALAAQASHSGSKTRRESAPGVSGGHSRNASASSIHALPHASSSPTLAPSARDRTAADPPLLNYVSRPQSEVLTSECEAIVSPKAASSSAAATAPSTVFVAGSGGAGAGATPSRRQSGALVSSRYAPQALSPSSPPPSLVAAATAAAAASASQISSLQLPQAHTSSTKIQLQLMPLPSSAPNPAGGAMLRESHDSSVRRLHFGGGGGPDADDDPTSDDEFSASTSSIGSAQRNSRTGPSQRGAPSNSPPLPLPNVTPGSLVVPAGLTVRRLLGYVCQRLWKAAEHSALLPREMKEEMERQRAANRAKKEAAAADQRDTSAARAGAPDGSASAVPDARNKMSLSTPSKAGPPASARGSGSLLSPATGADSVLSPGAIQLSASPSVANASASTPVRDSPSVLRRTISISMASVAHWERDALQPHQQGGGSSPPSSAHSPSPAGAVAVPEGRLRLPEQFLQLLLWDGHSSTVHVLPCDMEVGSVKEVVWPKMRRMAAQSSAASAAGSKNDRRNSASVRRGTGGGGLTLSPYGSPHSPGSTDTNDGGAASSRLMLLYYCRTPAGEEWHQSQARSGSLSHDAPRTTLSHHPHPGSRTPVLGGMATPMTAASPPPLPSSRAALRMSQSRRDGSANVPSAIAQPPVVVSVSPAPAPRTAAPAAAPTSATHPSAPVVPRIIPGVQTANNLRVAVPISLPVGVGMGGPIRVPQTASAHGATAPLPVSSPRRPAALISSSGVPATLPSAARPSSAHRGADRAADPMNQANTGVILSRHRTPGK